jgi:hypothetical protein
MANVKEIKILLSGIAQKILAPGIDVHTTCVKKFLDHIGVPVTGDVFGRALKPIGKP